MSSNLVKWILFIALSIIWGSSFMLMKLGLYDQEQQVVLSPYDVAALRMLSSGIVMLPFLKAAIRRLDKAIIGYVLLSGWLGSFFPAFLFCVAETKIDGAIAGSLNALTPLFVVITGFIFFNIKTTKQKVVGVTIGLLGCALLTYANYDKPITYIAYTGFVILATIFYGMNVNMVYKKLTGISSVDIAAIAFTGLIPPSIIVLLSTGYFNLPLRDEKYMVSSFASAILGILGTALASVFFYMLVKKAGGLFASLVTYGIPFVAIGWGLYYHEHINAWHVIALLIILLGVFVANYQTTPKEK